MGLDDLGNAQLADPPMTVFDVDNKEIGRKTIELMIEIIEKKNINPKRINVAGKIIERKSTGEVKK
jgi:DNA-binding LacI/PurR family transcriptional regulator